MAQRAFSDFIGFARASAAWRFNSSGVLVQEAANAQRDDYDPVSGLWNGLLIEESRTNLIRNNSMAGSPGPGVSPTFWSIPWTSSNGITWSFVGAGSENGIPYIDLRLSGTASAQTYLPISIETPGALTPGQTYTLSGYFRLVAGSLTGGTYGIGEGLRMVETLSSGGPLYNGINIGAITGAPLVSQRYKATKVIDALTTNTNVSFQVPVSSGQTIDATIRIGAPQLEQGAFATSPILTTSAQVTRAADNVTVSSLTPWFNPNGGTVYIEAVPTRYSAKLVSFDDGTQNNRIQVDVNASGDRILVLAGGVTQAQPLTATPSTLGMVSRYAAAWNANDFAVVRNGGAVATASAGALPVVTGMRIGADTAGSSGVLGGWLRALKYAPRRMTNAELQAMTTLPNANGPTLAFDFKAQTYNLEHI